MTTDTTVAPTTTGTLTLTLVRHGRTYLNQRRLLQGRSDSPLTREGREGVRTTARHLAQRSFVAAYSSPSGRAVATAAEILRHHEGVRLRTDPGLREYHFGEYERKHESVLDQVIAWPELVGEIIAGTHPGLPGGEDAVTFLGRLREAMARIAAAHPDGGEVLVVGHGLALGVWLATVGDGVLVPLPNASVSQVRLTAEGLRVDDVALDVAQQGVLGARPARQLVVAASA
ncbi:histidine phosphatase family protein [Actinotalea sp. AC32]|nr:histidine phosphatase family protein [Actinotalea sp. AC32]